MPSVNLNLEFYLLAATVISGGVVLLHRVLLGKTEKGERHWLHEACIAIFPVLLLVVVLRSFVVEPFRIPSGSMLPTLEIGDFILVDKFTYGLRLPVFHNEIFGVGAPERGDVAVFRYPVNPKQDFIKRIIGVPGDMIEYRNKIFYVNGRRVKRQDLGGYEKSRRDMTVFREALDERRYDTLASADSYGRPGRWRVPDDHYFVAGDNRDNSNDSRFWGFVPRENLVGRAFYIWFNWRFDDFSVNLSRIGRISVG